MNDVVVVGAGPAGLASAIAASRSGLSCTIVEQGSIADAIRRFPINMTWFSTPELLEIGGVPFVISTVRPTRVDTLNYYMRVARQFNLHILTRERVTDIRRNTGLGFSVMTAGGKQIDGTSVVIATGYYDHPVRLGVPGEDLSHVFHYYDEPFRYAGKRVVVVGGRNSAVETALDLYRHGAQVTMIHRGPSLSTGVKYWIQPDCENRIKAGEIEALFNATVRRIGPESVVVQGAGGEGTVPADFVFVLIGYGPDSELLRRSGVLLDAETLAPVPGPRPFATNIPGMFVAGSVVAGKNTNTIFVENGRLHGEAIIRTILADRSDNCSESRGRDC
jgi:thioredoxin reductase (NADPH)